MNVCSISTHVSGVNSHDFLWGEEVCVFVCVNFKVENLFSGYAMRKAEQASPSYS